MTQSTQPDSKVSVESFARHAGGQMIPVNSSLSYFSVIPLEDAELQRLIYDPASAMPARLGTIVPKLRLVIVGFLEASAEGADDSSAQVAFQPPDAAKRLFSATVTVEEEVFIFLPIKGEDMADSHDSFYFELARVVAKRSQEFRDKFAPVVRNELKGSAHGEIDDRSWMLKEELLRSQSDSLADTDAFRAYVEQALTDTLALYCHGLCCDIDVESGPRQLPSKWIRKRLLRLKDLAPPPKGVALFPEELTQIA